MQIIHEEPNRTDEPKTTSKGAWLFCGAAVVFLALVLSAGDSSTATSTATTDPATASNRLACERFRNIQDDIAAGLLTPAEVSRKFREVNRYQANPRISVAAQRLVIADLELQSAPTYVPGSADKWVNALREMDAACSAEGL